MNATTFVTSGPLSLRPKVLTPSSKCSSFTPSNPICTRPLPPQPVTKSTRQTQIQMRKGRSRQPMQQPRRQEQMSLPEDGTPVFAIFVRSPRAKLWYPLGAVKGDDRSKGLVDAMKGNFAKGMYENALDRGMAQTIYGKDSSRFLQNALRMYPQLKKSSRDLEFGYRVAAVGLEDQPTKVLSKEMALPFLAWAKQKIDTAFKGIGK